MTDSIVRNNLMTQHGYSPYCGDPNCRKGMPRTTFDGQQFVCLCGWRSEFPEDFITQYINHWAKVEQRYADAADYQFRRQFGIQ
jgi:hypothetical protein